MLRLAGCKASAAWAPLDPDALPGLGPEARWWVRVDQGEKPAVWIDPTTARDFDDALSQETDKSGNRVLGVHIADVAHFVPPDSELDIEATTRGNSVYLPDRVLPMLPEQLSNSICSLRPEVDRLAFSAFLTVDGAGAVIARSFAKTIICSKRRLTYRQAISIIRENDKEAKGKKAGKGTGDKSDNVVTTSLLIELHTLAQQMRQSRMGHDALELDMPEVEIVLGDDGMISDIVATENDFSHQLVEECMLAANEAVATELSARNVVTLARLHEPPSIQKLADLKTDLAELGYKTGDLSRRHVLAGFLRSISEDPLAHYARLAVLRSMQRAVYSETGTGHFGLAKEYYTHFTSPIRRYPDLVIHRQLAELLVDGRLEGLGPDEKRENQPRKVIYSKRELGAIAVNCSDTERAAEEAERSLIEIKKLRYLMQELKKDERPVHDAAVVKVTNFGMFVELLDIHLQGLVHISTISDSFVRFDEAKETLRADRKTYTLGSRVRVTVGKVDFDNRRADFFLAKE